MYTITFPSQDTTLYERIPIKNTGIDSILQIIKQVEVDSEILDNLNIAEVRAERVITNSRALLKFDYSSIQQEVTARSQSPSKILLKLYATEIGEIPYEYTIEALPVAQQWVNGTGLFGDSPSTTNGASWYSASQEAAWNFSTSGATGSWGVGYCPGYPGGGVWYTSSIYTGSVARVYGQHPDVVIDITSGALAHIAGDIDNYGWIVKLSEADEKQNGTVARLSFYSRESRTVFTPKLIAYWENQTTGSYSYSEVTSLGDYVVRLSNLKNSYSTKEKVTLRLYIRDTFRRVLTFDASPEVPPTKLLPLNSTFQITDTVTDHVVLPYADFSQIGRDEFGNYITMNMSNLQPERFYYISIRSTFADGNVIELSNIGFFKVSRI